jgi:hypothetical protein
MMITHNYRRESGDTGNARKQQIQQHQNKQSQARFPQKRACARLTDSNDRRPSDGSDEQRDGDDDECKCRPAHVAELRELIDEKRITRHH